MQPLDLHNETTPESTASSHQSSATVKKTNVRCYFYYNSFCNKGSSCLFSHGPNRFTPPTGKSLKDSSAVTGWPLSKNDPIVRKAIESNSGERKVNLSKTVPKETAQYGPASDNVLKHSEPHEVHVAKIEVASVEGSGSFLPVDLTLQRSHFSTNQSLEEQAVTEKQWKVSPGFHVFANGNNSENLYCEDDQEEYSPQYVQYVEELNSPLSGYDFEEPSPYDPMNPHAEIFCEYGVYDSSRNLESAHSLCDAGTVRDELSGRTSDILWSAKRDLLHIKEEVGDCSNVADLRDHLSRRRVDEDHSASCLLRRHYSSRSNGYRRTGLKRNRFSQGLDRKLTTLLGKNPVGSVRDYGFSFNVVRKNGALRHSRVQNFRKYKGKRQLYATRASKHSFPWGCRSHLEECAAFVGPKTLDQIKEEQMRAKLNREDSAGCLRVNPLVDFQGPKPLSELLKKKTG